LIFRSFVVAALDEGLFLDFVEFVLVQEKCYFMFILENLFEEISAIGFGTENQKLLTIFLGIEEQCS